MSQPGNTTSDHSGVDALRNRLNALADEAPVATPSRKTLEEEAEHSSLPGSPALDTRGKVDLETRFSPIRKVLIVLAIVAAALLLLTRGGEGETNDTAPVDGSAEIQDNADSDG